MPVPLISALPTVPSYDNTNFESLAPAFLSFLKNTFQAEMNAAIAAINAYDYGAAVNISKVFGLSAGRIPYGDGSNPIASDPTFKYDSAKKILHVPGIISSRVNPLKDLDSDADLYRVNNTNLFGSLLDKGQCSGGVLAPNGKIYGIPSNSTQVLEIDPVAGTTNLFGSLSSDTGKWQGGVLAPNGKIYGIPHNSTQVLEIDPESGTTNLFGYLTGTFKWVGGVLAPNGKIYGIPHRSTQVLEIDPESGTTNLFGSLSGDAKWHGGVLATNGKIYGIPSISTQVLEIDPVAGTTNLFGSLSSDTYKWHGGVLAPNGKIYGIPSNFTQVLEIDNISGISPTWELSAYLNKF